MDTRIASLLAAFQTQSAYQSSVPYGSGHINDTYLIETRDPNLRYVLQRINKKVFQRIPELMENIERVTTHIKKKINQDPDAFPDMQVLSLIKTQDQKNYHVDADGQSWRLYNFVDQAHSYDVVENATQAYQAGIGFGQFQNLLDDLPQPPLHETIVQFHHINARLSALYDAYDHNPQKRAKNTALEMDFVLEHADFMHKVLHAGRAGQIPKRVTHNDTKLNNLLFNAQDQAVCVVDLDTLMPGYIHYDYSDCLRTITSSCAEDEADLSKVSMNMDYFAAFSKGFLSQVGDKLNDYEKALLVDAAPLLPYMIGVRFLTDYLEGDHYFKTKFKEHNLQRAKTQFALAQSMLDQKDQMQVHIDKILQCQSA